MQFRVISTLPRSKEAMLIKDIMAAKLVVLSYPFGADEVALDNYLIQNYKTGLRACCLQLLFKLKATQLSATETLLVFQDEQSDLLARLITFGVDQLVGSRILVNALNAKF